MLGGNNPVRNPESLGTAGSSAVPAGSVRSVTPSACWLVGMVPPRFLLNQVLRLRLRLGSAAGLCRCDAFLRTSPAFRPVDPRTEFAGVSSMQLPGRTAGGVTH
jgi:hypothetical protein